MPPTRNVREAFTLIELLVVVTIIVVLLALLTPALDAAIRSAELAACGANLKSMTTGGIQYAHGNRRHYPTRGPSHEWDALIVKIPGNFDMTAQLAPYVGLNGFLDPLGGEIDLALGSQSGSPPVLYANYQTYFSWGHPNQRVKPALRVGEQMVFNAPEGDIRKFPVLIADLDDRRKVGGGAFNPQALSSHPDDEGRLQFFKQTNDYNRFIRGVPLINSVLTVSWWQGDAPPNPADRLRGLCDYNYGMNDGSVTRLDKVEIDDERCLKIVMTGIGEYQSDDRKAQLPKQK